MFRQKLVHLFFSDKNMGHSFSKCLNTNEFLGLCLWLSKWMTKMNYMSLTLLPPLDRLGYFVLF